MGGLEVAKRVQEPSRVDRARNLAQVPGGAHTHRVLRGMGYEAGREALRPRAPAPATRASVPATRPAVATKASAPATSPAAVAPVLDTSTPGLEAFGTAGAACSCGHPQSPDLQAATRKAERRLQRWYVDATNAVQDARSQMGRAGDRFAEFAGGGVKSLKAATGTAGGIASILFGTPGRAAGVLANVIVDAAAASPSGGIRAGLARRLDDQKDAADAAVQRRYDGLTASMERVAGTPEAGAFEASIDHVRICRVPGENALYRDLLLKFADDKRMKLDGGWTCELHYQKYYQSWNSSVPFWMDGQEVADELNRMVQIEPSIRKPFRSNERP